MSEINPVIQAAMDYFADGTSYMSMTDLGKVLGVSSHVVGRNLKELGLRDPDGTPSQSAQDGKYVQAVNLNDGVEFFVWDETKTLAVLRKVIKS